MQNDIYFDGFEYDQLGAGDSREPTFYAQEAAKGGGRILELGSGTGRLSIPLAQAGHTVTGLDRSLSMQRRAAEKALAANVAVRFIPGDMCNLSLGEKFDMVMLPNNTISHLHELAQLRCLFQGVRSHLAVDGRFVVETFNPSLKILTRPSEPRHHIAEYRDAQGRLVTVDESNTYDTATQVNHTRFYYRREGETGEVVRDLALRMFFPQEFRALLEGSGFAIEVLYGDFLGGHFESSSSRQIAVCVAC